MTIQHTKNLLKGESAHLPGKMMLALKLIHYLSEDDVAIYYERSMCVCARQTSEENNLFDKKTANGKSIRPLFELIKT